MPRQIETTLTVILPETVDGARLNGRAVELLADARARLEHECGVPADAIRLASRAVGRRGAKPPPEPAPEPLPMVGVPGESEIHEARLTAMPPPPDEPPPAGLDPALTIPDSLRRARG